MGLFVYDSCLVHTRLVTGDMSGVMDRREVEVAPGKMVNIINNTSGIVVCLLNTAHHEQSPVIYFRQDYTLEHRCIYM